MNKTELIKEISNKSELTSKQAESALKALTESITETLKDKDKVTLSGFGTFEVADRAARTGRNPKTGEEVKIKASTAPKFRAGKALKDAVVAKPAKASKTKKAK